MTAMRLAGKRAERNLTEQVMTVKQLSQEQVHYSKGYADALENVVMR